jgi:dTDP-4-dehydrorhamnose reductase
MRILITGASGMLGLDVQSTATALGHEFVALPRAELDITDAAAVEQATADAAPDAVINCAAYTNVDGAESDEQTAQRVNGAGAGNVARAAAAAGAWTVHVSSDYVFDGTKAEPYVESDPTNPLSVYGASKLAGEQAVAAAAPGRHTIVRSSWLFGAGGPCFPATILKLAAERDELNVVDDQRGCPTFTPDLARALLELAGVQPEGVFHASASGQCSWYEFAREIVSGAGLPCTVRPCTTAEFPRPAPRPANSVLRSERGTRLPVLRDWRLGLRDYLGARVAA